MKLISVVIPLYNEEAVIDELKTRLQKVVNKLKDYSFEFIMVENGSVDSTYDKLVKLHKEDRRFKIVKLSRNFGCDGGISAGLTFAEGDAAVIMNADLQDPPEIIPKFIEKWNLGYDMVYGIITKRVGVSFLRRTISYVFYIIMNILTKGVVPRNVSDFRLVDRKVYKVIANMPEHNRFLRGMFAWSGFKQTGVPFTRPPRFKQGGELKDKSFMERFFNSFNYTINAVFLFSDFPLKVITGIGLITSLSSFCVGLYFFLSYLIFGSTGSGYVQGHTSLILIITFLFGILFLCLGVMGEYISRIFEEVKSRPNFVIQNTIGFKNEAV